MPQSPLLFTPKDVIKNSKYMKPTLFQYAILFHPTEKEIKDDGAKSTGKSLLASLKVEGRNVILIEL